MTLRLMETLIAIALLLEIRVCFDSKINLVRGNFSLRVIIVTNRVDNFEKLLLYVVGIDILFVRI